MAQCILRFRASPCHYRFLWWGGVPLTLPPISDISRERRSGSGPRGEPKRFTVAAAPAFHPLTRSFSALDDHGKTGPAAIRHSAPKAAIPLTTRKRTLRFAAGKCDSRCGQSRSEVFVGAGLFLFGSCAAAFVASFLAHGFMTSTHWNFVTAVALLPCLVSLAVSSGSVRFTAFVFGFSLAGSALGALAVAGLRLVKARLG